MAVKVTDQTRYKVLEQIVKDQNCEKILSNIEIFRKRWNDFDESDKDIISELSVRDWKNKNIKNKNKNDLIIVEHYLKNNNDNVEKHKIIISNEHKFNIIIYNGNNIRQEIIFKLNLSNIIKKLKKYFKNVYIDILFEENTWLDKQLKLTQFGYKHDVVINIKKKYNKDDDDDEDEDEDEDKFEIVLEYNEKNHDRFKDADKKLSSEQSCDKFIVYDEKTDNKEDFYKNTIYSIILFICATTNEIGKLGNILNYKNNLKNNEFFNEIIAYKQNKTFNVEKFFNDFWLRNMNTYEINTDELYTVEDFIAFIETDKNIELDIDDEYNCNIEIFDKLIMSLDDNDIDSNILRKYKNTYLNVLNVLNEASYEIIKIMKIGRNKRFQLPTYIKNLLQFHKQGLKL